MNKLMVAVVAGAVALGAQAGTFLDSLNADSRKVDSSPYATGGDIILKVSDVEYIHVFTSTAAVGSFEPTADLFSRVLLIGGGGAGAVSNGSVYPGGGGAGGFVEARDVTFVNGTAYAVTVGAGGQKSGSSGSVSSIAGTEFETITAYGGGGGGRSSAGAAGGSGGGGSGGTVYAGGAAKDDGAQGFPGLSGSSVAGGAGGGAGGVGAPSVGTDGNDPKAIGSAGGPGKPSDILGFEQYFAGGGSGSSKLHKVTPGGIGGGGKGGAASTSDTTDVYGAQDGLGGGGGGVFQESNSGKFGKGGSGIVVIRYAVTTSGEPALGDIRLTNAGGSALTLAGQVAYSGESPATVKIKLWPTSVGEAGEGTVTVDVTQVEAGRSYADFEEIVAGLSYDTAYSYQCWVENANGASAVKTGTISTYSERVEPIAVLTEGGAEVVAVTNGFNWIYTFEQNGSFTIPAGKTALAKVLVVGGGGAGGGWGGGGGAGGGVKYYPTYVLAAGTYPIVVGKGGVHTTSNGSTPTTAHGGASSFGEIAVSGGGAGANPFYAANNAGCSDATLMGASSAGGIGTSSGYSKLAIEGEGHAGGNGKSLNGKGTNGSVGYSGGGGGAGTPGEDATVEKGGDGGDGLACAITGAPLYYGAGGGGSYYCKNAGYAGAGGLGGGGDGGNYERENKNGLPGTFYGAGGGSGALNESKNDSYGGDGYQGVVIVVLTDYSAAGGAPILEMNNFTDITETSAKVAVNVPTAGSGATVSLTAYWGYAEGDYSADHKVLATKMIGEGAYTLDGLSPNRKYYVKIVADNGTGGDDATAEAVGSFTTAGALSGDPGSTTHTQANYSFKYTISALGDGVTTGFLYVADSILGLDAVEPVHAWELTEPGENLAVGYLFNPQTAGYQFGKTYYYRLGVVNNYGDGFASTNLTTYGEFVLTDNATYTWKGETGDWNDSTKWTCSVEDSVEKGYSFGYPVYGANARFADAMCTTVRVTKAERCSNVNYNYTGFDLTIIGTSPDAKIVPDAASVGNTSFASGSTYRFDGVEVFAPFWGSGRIPANVSVTLENGAKLTSNRYGNGWEWLDMVYAGSDVTVKGGAAFNVGSFYTGNGVELTADGGTIAVNGGFDLSKNNGNWAPDVTSAAVLRIGGEGSKVSATGAIAASVNPAAIGFTVPAVGYSAAPITCTTFAASGKSITLTVPKTSPVRAAVKQDIPLVNATTSLDPTKVVFGATARSSDYFYFTETDAADAPRYMSAEEAAGKTIKYIWYHHEPDSGTVLIVW